MILRFVHGKTRSEIAEIFCISPMHVSRLLARTLRQLRAEIDDRADGENLLELVS